MADVCVLLAGGFEEIEAITTIDVLRRAGLRVKAVGVGAAMIEGAHGIRVHADLELSEAASHTWDLVALPGGMPGAARLRDDPGVQDLVRAQHARGGRVAAICAAPIALGAAGVLDGKRATCYPGFEDGLGASTRRTDRVVRDGNVTTSRGPGTALDFALALVADMEGAAAAAAVAERMLVDYTPAT